MTPTKKMAFYEVGRGKFGREIQSDFEEAQAISQERKVPVTIKMEMTIHPPDEQDPRFGNIDWKHEIKQPPIKSLRYTTELDNGRIVSDGMDQTDILQLNLALDPHQNTTQFKERGINGTDDQ